MKNLFYSILLFAGVCFAVASCSKGAYTASTDSNANNGVNPLTPLTAAQFDWIGGGKDPMSANINGTPWVASGATWALDTVGGNIIIGNLGGQVMYLYLNQVYGGGVYSMGYHDYLTSGTWSDSVGSQYFSYASYLGNSGEVYITHNDSVYIQGLFYFKGITPSGQIVSVTDGYFKLNK